MIQPSTFHQRSFPPQDHGGDAKSICKTYGLCEATDFSASINPLGHPKGLEQHLQANWSQLLHYPDRNSEELRIKASKKFGVPADNILAGNGSAELIELTLRAMDPSCLVLSPPDFGLYESLAPEHQPTFKVPRLKKLGFLPDIEKLCEIVRPGNLIIFSNPCNPSGRASLPDDIFRLIEKCRHVGAILAVDEAFVDFYPRAGISAALNEYDNLIIFRSMTKFFGIPGLRLGFLLTSPSLANKIARLQVPWSVNTAAQISGTYCLEHNDWESKTLKCIEKNRSMLHSGLEKIPGFKPIPSDVNYILVEVSHPAPPADEICHFLASKGILVRNCESFGLGNRFIRLAVRTEEEITLLLSALNALPTPRAALELQNSFDDDSSRPSAA